MAQFHPLPLASLKPSTGYCRPYYFAPNPVKVTSSALEVMTDLRYVAAAVVPATLDVETASQKMIARGVRALLVTNDKDDVIGIVTARDLIGGRLDELLQHTGRHVSSILVQEIMTGQEKVEVLPLEEVLHAHVGDIVETLKYSGRQHALVVEDDAMTGKPSIRGIFSASQIARQLGIVLNKQELAYTFDQIDAGVRDRLAQSKV